MKIETKVISGSCFTTVIHKVFANGKSVGLAFAEYKEGLTSTDDHEWSFLAHGDCEISVTKTTNKDSLIELIKEYLEEKEAKEALSI